MLSYVLYNLRMGWHCKPVIDNAICNQCLSCISKCPYNVFYVGPDNFVKIDYAKCKGCGVCTTVCPYGAIDCQWVPTSSHPQSGLKQSS